MIYTRVVFCKFFIDVSLDVGILHRLEMYFVPGNF